MRKIADYSLRLLIVCTIASGLLAYVYETTFPRIQANIEKEKLAKVKDLLPEDTLNIKELKKDQIIFFRGFSRNSQNGTIIETSSNGYGGPINLLVGIDKDGKVTDVAVVSHKETPGLGAKIEETKFLGQFKGRGPRDVMLKKDSGNPNDGIDAIAAATISSRAVTKAVRESLEKYGEVKNVR